MKIEDVQSEKISNHLVYLSTIASDSNLNIPDGETYGNYLYWDTNVNPPTWQVKGDNNVAIGSDAGRNNQGTSAVAIGMQAGLNNQGQESIAIGKYAGFASQGTGSIAIGSNAAAQSLGEYSIAIGANAGGASPLPANTIFVNANGQDSNTPKEPGFYINKIYSKENIDGYYPLYYNPNNNNIIHFT